MIAENKISALVLRAAFDVHRKLGPRLVAGSYSQCLAYEIERLGLSVVRNKKMPLVYGDLKVNVGYEIDLLVEKRVLVYVKSCEKFSELDMIKMQTYLKLSGCKVGFLINFNVTTLKIGIRRVLASYEEKKKSVRTAS